ncbi:unnamed protein product [Merluccius merluccius]
MKQYRRCWTLVGRMGDGLGEEASESAGAADIIRTNDARQTTLPETFDIKADLPDVAVMALQSGVSRKIRDDLDDHRLLVAMATVSRAA